MLSSGVYFLLSLFASAKTNGTCVLCTCSMLTCKDFQHSSIHQEMASACNEPILGTVIVCYDEAQEVNVPNLPQLEI